MKTLIIPDIHNKWQRAQLIMDENPADARVFLADIYDDFNDTLDDIRSTAVWHKTALADPKNLFLLGNHDMGYAFPAQDLPCSGWTHSKLIEIQKIISDEDWAKCRFFTWVDGWLLSHAGLCNGAMGNDISLLPANADAALEQARMIHGKHWLTGAGQARGGSRPYGGLTWCDFNDEFSPFPGVRQIFGHTPGRSPRQVADNWCLDTNLNHAAFLDGGSLEIFAV